MKTNKVFNVHFLALFFVASFVFVSCQNDEEMTDIQANGDLATIDVQYLAESFYKTVTNEEAVRVASAYQAMDYEQASSFIEARYRINLKENMSARQAASIRDLMHEVNENVFDQTGQSYASADQDIAATMYSALIQTEKYADAAYQYPQDSNETSRTAAASCPNGNWFNTKNTPWNTTTQGTQWPVSYIGRFNFNGTSNDCDYVLRSQNYNIYFRTAVIRPISGAAINALSFGGSTSNPAKEPGVNSSEARFEFLIGKGRVDINYPGFNAPQRFARDTRVVLVPR